eukprot:gene17590-27079_t
MDKKLVNKATTNTPDPTMGHMYRDIANLTHSDGKICLKLCTYVMDRLTGSKGTWQIIKTLKVIKYCAANGHPDFQKAMQKRCDELRTYSSYRGAEDPVHGTALNEQVKASAREAIEACFQEQVASKVAGTINGMGGGSVQKDKKDDPFKDSQLSHGEFGSLGLAPSMSGMGNTGAPVQAPSKFKEEWKKHNVPKESPGLTGFASSTLNSMTKPNTYMGQFAQAATSGFGFLGNSNHDAMMKQYEDEDTGSQLVMDPTIMASIHASEQQPAFGGGGGGGGGFKFLTEGQSAGPTASVSRLDDSTVALNRGQQIVDGAVALKTIGRSEISRFTREVKQAMEDGHSDDVTQRLDEKINAKAPWQQRLNALTLIEGLARAEIADVLEYFTENPEDIYKNLDVVQTSLKEKARKCLQSLGLPPKRGARAAPFDDGEGTPAASNLLIGEQQPQAAVEDPRGGRKAKSSAGIKKRTSKKNAALEAPSQGSDLFNSLSSMMPPTAADPASAFGLSKTASAPAPMPASVPTPAPQPVPSDAQGMSGFTFPAANAHVAAPQLANPPAPDAAAAAAFSGPVASLFDFEQPKPAAPPQPAAAAARSNNGGGNAFGNGNDLDFLFGPPSSAAPPSQPQAVQPAPSSAAADPLGSFLSASPPKDVNNLSQQLASLDSDSQMKLLAEQQALLAQQIAALQMQVGQ